MKAFFIFLIAFFFYIDGKGITILIGKEFTDSTFKHAEFIGGEDSLFRYIYSHLKYPKYAEITGIEGTVVVEFTIDSLGKTTDVIIKQAVESSLDSEAVKVISNFPIWIPPTKNGKPIEATYKLPINFKIKEPISIVDPNWFPEFVYSLPYLFAALISTILITIYMVNIFYSPNRR